MTQPGIPSEIRDRIFQVANELYDEANREKMPTVDQVRRAAKADMNTTSSVMREWRKQQTSQVAPVIVTVPERVQDEFQGRLLLPGILLKKLLTKPYMRHKKVGMMKEQKPNSYAVKWLKRLRFNL
ncbi:DNA-binding protein (plasmid) [Vibrio alginolyticus]|uniref:DNA-binding protein n=1 Tax=Vibrio alginolyticus TaxID=663 RepID=UPI001EEECFF5|nr:DNA-binding protein [Vibrio alginolyticus]ULF72059.1 DNA-binding protein [Vibrio alginolyticus]